MTRLLLASYRWLLRLLPRRFRSTYGEEMGWVLEELLRERPARSRLAVFLGAVSDLGATAVHQHALALRSPAPVPAVEGPAPAPAMRPVRRAAPRPSRRRFLRTAAGAAAGVMGSGMISASIAYLWPRSGGGFGSVVDLGSAEEIGAMIEGAGGRLPVPSARTYLVRYDPADDPEGRYRDLAGGSGALALYQKCVHLGCRVPWCASSTRFECPCHGSKYNRWGEFQDGPAPRGLDRFAVQVSDGRVLVDTRTVVTGPARTVDTLGEDGTGPACTEA